MSENGEHTPPLRAILRLTMSLSADACYHALAARDTRFDGVFFTGVRTTGIYCRSVCPARTPRRDSCLFFGQAAEAELAGFRPCLRCRPELAPGLQGASLAESLLRRIQERAVEGVRLEDLETDLGLGTRQVRRLLRSAFGVTPAQVAQTQRLLLAKQLLEQTTQPVSEVALAAGFRSLRRFNALFRTRYGVTPTDIRRTRTGAVDALELRLSYREPFAWQALLDYLRSRLVPGVEEIVEGEYRRTVALAGHSGWLRIRRDLDKPALIVTVSPSLSRVLGAVQCRVRRMFDLDAQPQLIAEALGGDPLLAPTMARHPGLRVGGAWDTFELAVRAVLGQQITVAAATTLSGRLVSRIALRMETPFPGLHHLAVTPDGVLGLGVDDLCRLGLVSARANTLLHLAKFARDGGLNFPPGLHHDQAVKRLVALPGIGPWTAHYIAMRALRYPDAFPAADLGLRKAIGQGVELVSAKAAEQRAEAWHPWRAYAAAILWKSLDPSP